MEVDVEVEGRPGIGSNLVDEIQSHGDGEGASGGHGKVAASPELLQAKQGVSEADRGEVSESVQREREKDVRSRQHSSSKMTGPSEVDGSSWPF